MTPILRRIGTFALYCIPAFFIASFTIGVLASVNDQLQTPSEHEDGEKKPLFIPLGWIKPRPRTFYNETDPEITMFKEIMQNQAIERSVIGA